MKSPIRILIVDDHPMVIEGMTAMLQQEGSVELAGHAMSAASCMGFFVSQTVDVVLMDINLPDKNGTDLCRELKEKYPAVQVLGISNFDQGGYIREMMKQGASGYVMKNVSRDELLKAIRTVYQGHHYLSSEAGHAVRLDVRREESLPLLTKREREVLKLISDGMTNPEIAEKLFVSPSTIDTHRKSLLVKFGVSNTAVLVRMALENKLI